MGHWGLLWGLRGPFWGCLGASGSVGVYWGGKWTGSPTTLGPVQGSSTPTDSPGGVMYWANAKKVIEMSTAGYYIHFELYIITVFIFVYMPPHHIFLHTILGNVLWIYGLFSLQTNLCISLHDQ